MKRLDGTWEYDLKVVAVVGSCTTYPAPRGDWPETSRDHQYRAGLSMKARIVKLFQGHDWRDSRDPARHLSWALSVDSKNVITDILQKYDIALTYVKEGRGTGENTWPAFLGFYALSSERLAMWGARCINEVNNPPEPADRAYFLQRCQGWDEQKIRQDLKDRIAYLANFFGRW